MRNPIETIKNPKVKSVLITILEILIVAGIIFGVLMFIYSKVNKEADKKSGIAKTQETTVSKKSVKYFLTISKKHNVVVAYKYTDNLNEKSFVKAFKASVGKKAKSGTYKTKNSYDWMKTNGAWHQLNTAYAKNGFIQSVAYKDKYPNTMKRTSYKALGFEEHKDNCIWLTCDDAKWVRKNAYRITVEVVGKKAQFTVPKANYAKPKLVKACGWDPTDSNKNNPYKKQKNSVITFGVDTVIIEKGRKVNYLDNIIAKDSKGNVITKNLKFKKIDSKVLATYKVQYKYKKENLNGYQKFKVVDTTPPKVTIADNKFEFELKSLDVKDVVKQSNIDKIKKMVQDAASVNEDDCLVSVRTIDKEDLNEGKVSVVVTAKDKSGNIGAAQAFVKVKVKEEKVTKFKPPKKHKKKHKKKVKKHKKKIKKKVKKIKHKKKKKKTKKKQVETETVIEE